MSIVTISLPSTDLARARGISFVAHTGNSTVEMYDGWEGVYLKTITGVPEASGVLCAQAEKLAFAASRGTGKVLVLDGMTGSTIRRTRR